VMKPGPMMAKMSSIRTFHSFRNRMAHGFD
jgi:hypothetical protein